MKNTFKLLFTILTGGHDVKSKANNKKEAQI